MIYTLASEQSILTLSRTPHPYSHSSISAAENGLALRQANITHILSITTRTVAYPNRIKLEIKRVELEDDPDAVRVLFKPPCYVLILCSRGRQDVIPIFPETNAFIEGAIKGGGTVLVHWCVMYWYLQFQRVFDARLRSDMGVSRSVTMVAAYRQSQHSNLDYFSSAHILYRSDTNAFPHS
jgi:hypothetical protein